MDRRHPKCECQNGNSAVSVANELLMATMMIGKSREACVLTLMLAVQLTAVYLRDTFDDEVEAEAMERDARDKALQIYVGSQQHFEKNGVRTTLSKKRKTLC